MADDDAKARRTTKATASGPARKAAVKKAAAKKTSATRAAAGGAAAPKKATVKKASAKRAPAAVAAKKAPARRATTREGGAVLAPREKAPPRMRLAAEETFDDDDWPRREPEPKPVREDPAARVRAVLRAAALSLEAKEAGNQARPPARPVAPRAPEAPAPRPSDEPVTRVLVAPVPSEPDDEIDEEIEDEWVIEEDPEPDEAIDGDDWSPPEVLDEPPPPPPPPRPTPAPPPSATQVITAPPSPMPPAEKKPRRRRRTVVAIVLALVVVLGAAAAVAFVALRDEAIDYSELEVGDCFDSARSNEIRGVEVKPCSEPHNSEIFFLVTHPAGPDEPYPGKDTLVQFAADACLGQPLTDYLGIPLEQSQLKDFEIVPQQSAWDDGRRVLVCGVDTGGQGDITGSVKGTRR